MIKKVLLLSLVSFSSAITMGRESHLHQMGSILENFLIVALDFKHAQETIHHDLKNIINELSQDLDKVEILNREGIMLSRDAFRKLYATASSYNQLLLESIVLLKEGGDCSIENFKRKIEFFISQAILDIEVFFNEECKKVTILKPLLIDAAANFQKNKKQILESLWNNVRIEPISEKELQSLQQKLKDHQIFFKRRLAIIDSKAYNHGFEWLIKPFNQCKFYEFAQEELEKDAHCKEFLSTFYFRLTDFQNNLNEFSLILNNSRILRIMFNILSPLGFGRFIINWNDFFSDTILYDF